MRIPHEPVVDATVLDAAAILAIAMGGRGAGSTGSPGLTPARITTSAPVGAWLSSDGTVRLDLRTDGTYDGQVAGRRRRARGTYRFDGATLTLNDDSGLYTAVTVRESELEMAGHRLGRV
jgi:hypothetical protein